MWECHVCRVAGNTVRSHILRVSSRIGEASCKLLGLCSIYFTCTSLGAGPVPSHSRNDERVPVEADTVPGDSDEKIWPPAARRGVCLREDQISPCGQEGLRRLASPSAS